VKNVQSVGTTALLSSGTGASHIAIASCCGGSGGPNAIPAIYKLRVSALETSVVKNLGCTD
jgi:hypothetical protein